jgi:endonuclease YncB( thermonuclease family)
MRRLTPLLLLAVLAAAVPASPAAARTSKGPCVAGGTIQCTFWTGKVTSVNDGDTFDVDIDGDGTRRAFTTRITGIQSMEETKYSNVPSERRGECTAVEATAVVDHLLRLSHKRVRIAAMSSKSHASYRLLRAAQMKVNGRWVDLGETELSLGLALPWIMADKEWAFNGKYTRIAADAAARGVGLWNPAHCGNGPAWGVPFKVWVNWDSKEAGNADLSREWVKVKNLDPSRTVSLGGWWVRSGGPRRYHFPAGTTLGPGRSLTVYRASGQNSFDRFFWGLSNNSFPNATYDGRQIGEGVYLFDPKTNMRANSVYPCRVMCSDPLQGKVSVRANPDAFTNQYVAVTNTSNETIDLEGYQITTRYRFYPFGSDSVLGPGETLRVLLPGSPANDSRLVKFWGIGRPILRNPGESVTVKSFTDIVLDCYSWGAGSC